MVNVLGLTDFFNRSFTDIPVIETDFEQGYYSSNLDVLISKSRRSKAISEAKIWDYILVENDPNFSRSQSSGKLNKILSKLSLSSTLVTVFTSQLYMSELYEFIPYNLRSTLFNLTGLIDTNINLISNFDKRLPFSLIEEAFFKDLEFQYDGGNITFNELTNLANNILDSMPLADSIQNDSLRPLLSLGIQNLLPSSMIGIFQAAQYADEINSIFSNNTTKQNFNTELQNEIEDFSDNKVNTAVSENDYTNTNITFADPLGINLQSQFKSELQSSYFEHIEESVNTVGTRYGLTSDQKQNLIDILQADAQSNIESAFSKPGTGLPSLTKVSTALGNESHNGTRTAINNSIERLTNKIINQVGLKQTVNDPLDYLVNVKRNIKSRLEFKKRGVTTERFTEVDNYLKSVVKDGKITDEILEDLDRQLNELIPETDY